MKDFIQIKINENIKFSLLIKELDVLGYEQNDSLMVGGEYCKIGGTIKIRPINHEEVYTVEFFGDVVDSIRSSSANSVEELKIDTNILSFEDGTIIRPGDYVVHIDHGIGLYSRLGNKIIGDKVIKYIFLEYYNGDCLYLPINLKEKITKYIGVGRKPKLNKLGTQTWTKTKKKAYENALRLARELLQIYAKREISKREPYRIDRQWDDEIIKTFGYRETSDQISAISEVYTDLASEIPMDRLISGDVGFGKTEIAIRAITQAVANHKQVAVICPTTILCQQHFANITSRMEKLPVEIRMMSRFVKADKQNATLKEIVEGKVDVVVGTHRLFSNEVQFKELDLVVIDEEQRFGVKQKDHFKKMRASVNVLSLSATPIPRTLFMSLSGIRDISQIMTAPKGRKSIETEVAENSEEKVVSYIKNEISRGGQIFYLYNRVETIQAVKRKLEKLVPQASFAVAHGQMPEQRLSEVMDDFVCKKYDVLLCTTIIENGLDLPNVNTLIVEDADKYGLSQLYQIRGRIGRSEKQAFALLMHKESKLTVNAYKRLKSLVDNSELGSGFNIALSDLEIRGGGNILGKEQHGNMEAIGLVLYSQMLGKAVKRLQS